MATADQINQLNEALKKLNSVDLDRLKRTSLGEESLTKDLASRETKIQKLADLAKLYAPLVHNSTVSRISSTIETIANSMIAQATLESSEYLTQRDGFLQTIDTHIEEANNWKPILAGAAMLDRGFLDDEGLKRESERALANLQKVTGETLATIQAAAEKSIQGAKKLAEEIETKARRTATKISVVEAQNQFREASTHDAKQVKLWGWLAGASIILLIATPLLFMMHWPLPETGEWPVALYHTLLRVLVLSAIAGIATFTFRMLRVHLHLAEKNRHRVRVANSVESFVQSALEPAQRDLILARLTDSIVSFGDSGLVEHGGEDRPSPLSGDVLARIVAAISSKGSS